MMRNYITSPLPGLWQVTASSMFTYYTSMFGNVLINDLLGSAQETVKAYLC
jgi:hypothetical protein